MPDSLPARAAVPEVASEGALARSGPEDLLQPWDESFDETEGLLREVCAGSAYHSQMPAGRVVHPLRTSAFYAHALMVRGDAASVRRAETILNRLTQLQITDPLSPHFGIWGYYLEEPPEQMAPADFNWADFIAVRFLEILIQHGAQLSPGMRTNLEISVRHAVLSIFRRNVEVAYTNIAIMGATVAMMAGELAGDVLWVTFGRNRLRAVRELYERNGGFTEYNSPTYSLTALFELERILRLVQDPEARVEATILWRAIWEDLAQSFHPATGQLSGPQSRTYNDWLSEGQLRCLEQRLGWPLARRSPAQRPRSFLEELVAPGGIACPAELIERFRALPSAPVFRRQCRVRRADGRPSQVSKCWMSHQATLGSVSQEICWYQTRPVLGYWTAGVGELARCRVRVLLNGRDFASALLVSDQVASTVLAAVQFITDGGTYHPHFDRPEAGRFSVNDLRLRVEVEGKNLLEKIWDDRSFWWGNEFGGLAVTFGPAQFGGRPVELLRAETDGEVHAHDLVFYAGPEKTFELATVGETFGSVVLGWSSRAGSRRLTPPESLATADRRFVTWAREEENLVLRLARSPGLRAELLDALLG